MVVLVLRWLRLYSWFGYVRGLPGCVDLSCLDFEFMGLWGLVCCRIC